jgi:hypothetical protein
MAKPTKQYSSSKPTYGKGKKYRQRMVRRKANEIAKAISSGIVSQSAAMVLENVKEPDSPEQITAWLNRTRRGRTEPDTLGKVVKLSEDHTHKQGGGNKPLFESKEPHNNPQCALGYPD